MAWQEDALLTPWDNLDAYAFPVQPDSEGDQQTVDIQRFQDDFGSTLLAAEGMVPRPSKPSGGRAKIPSNLGKPAKTTKVTGSTST